MRKLTTNKTLKILFFLCCMLLCSCRMDRNSTIKRDYSFAIYDAKNNVVCAYENENNGANKNHTQPILVNSSKIKGENLYLRGVPYFYENEGLYVTKTAASPSDLKVSLSVLDSRNPERIKSKKLINIVDVYTLCSDSQYIYTVVCYIDRLEFYKYDYNLSLVSSKLIYNEGKSIAPYQLLSVDASLYLLVGYVDPLVSDEISTQIWKMDKDLNRNVIYNLPTLKGYNVRMIFSGEHFYVSNPNQTDNVYEGKGSCDINVFTEDTINHKMKWIKTITLENLYPESILFDKKNNKLLIQHDIYRSEELIWTVYDIENQTENILKFSKSMSTYDGEVLAPFFTINDGKYYFLFNEYMSIYNPQNKKLDKISYGTDEITQPAAMIFNTE